MSKELIYLDYNATTPVDPRVLEAMLPYFQTHFGNAASKTHAAGWIANDAVEKSRQQIASKINCHPSEIVFTSGATEAINLAIRGVFETYSAKGQHIICSPTEHKAVIDTCLALEKKGAEISWLPVSNEGFISPEDIKSLLRDDTILVIVMAANNETGALQAISEISEITHSGGALLLCDGTQAMGKIPVDVQEMGMAMMPFSAHKMYGPKGVGALYVRRKKPRVTLTPQMTGGGHENGRRSGTLNVPGIVGMGKAVELLDPLNENERTRELITLLRDRLSTLDDIIFHSPIHQSLPNTLSLSIRGIKAEELISKCPTLSMATGSACTSALPEPSHVLEAMGLNEEDYYNSIRLSIGRFTTKHEIDEASEILIQRIVQLRKQ